MLIMMQNITSGSPWLIPPDRCCATYSTGLHYIDYIDTVQLLMCNKSYTLQLTPKVLVATIDAQWEGMGDVGSARYEPALLTPCPTIRVLSNCKCQEIHPLNCLVNFRGAHSPVGAYVKKCDNKVDK